MQNIPYPLIKKSLPEVKASIVTTLAYFDMFNYPLTRAELYLFLDKKYSYDFFDEALQSLLNNGIIYLFDRFYTFKNNNYPTIRRNEGNIKAQMLINVAKRVGNILIRFPYVRGVAISGSLSKNFADERSDIDLFIITAENRLWMARTLMHCFKKLTFLVNKEHFFCMNYYVGGQHLEIAEKNIYTAIEIGTLIPLEGDVVFEKFYVANAWIRDFLPNKNMRVASARPVKSSFFKWLFEGLFNTSTGDAIDTMLMKITTARWLRKTFNHKLNGHGQVLAMVTAKHFAKPDPTKFQEKLLARYKEKVSRLLAEWVSSLAN